MNDQNQPNQPKLSLDEELDVLEAVYKIGKEKGLDLLRPEQVKKLEDAGRMVGAAGGAKSFGSKEALDVSKMVVKNMINEIDSVCRRIHGDSWEDWDEAKKISTAQKEFEKCYGADPIDFGISLFGSLVRIT